MWNQRLLDHEYTNSIGVVSKQQLDKKAMLGKIKTLGFKWKKCPKPAWGPWERHFSCYPDDSLRALLICRSLFCIFGPRGVISLLGGERSQDQAPPRMTTVLNIMTLMNKIVTIRNVTHLVCTNIIINKCYPFTLLTWFRVRLHCSSRTVMWQALHLACF